jgi:hypothetical protein
VRQKRRHYYRAGDGPHPGKIGWSSRPRLEDAPNVPAVSDHVVIVRPPCPGLALAGVAQNERPADLCRVHLFVFRHGVPGWSNAAIVNFGPIGSRLNNDALLRSSENMRAMKITDEDRERQETEASRRNDTTLGGIVLALLAIVFGVSALALMVG